MAIASWFFILPMSVCLGIGWTERINKDQFLLTGLAPGWKDGKRDLHIWQTVRLQVSAQTCDRDARDYYISVTRWQVCLEALVWRQPGAAGKSSSGGGGGGGKSWNLPRSQMVGSAFFVITTTATKHLNQYSIFRFGDIWPHYASQPALSWAESWTRQLGGQWRTKKWRRWDVVI